jgi:hypothetical protein
MTFVFFEQNILIFFEQNFSFIYKIKLIGLFFSYIFIKFVAIFIIFCGLQKKQFDQKNY